MSTGSTHIQPGEHTKGLSSALLWGALYLLVALTSNLLFAVQDAPFHPATGVALAGLILRGWRILPGLALGIFAEFWIHGLVHGNQLAQVFQFALMGILTLLPQACLGYGLIRRIIGETVDILTDRAIVYFLLIVLLTSALAPLLALITLHDLGNIKPGHALDKIVLHWVGHALGYVLVTPMLVVINQYRGRDSWFNIFRIISPLAFLLVATTIWLFGFINLEMNRRDTELQKSVDSAATALETTIESFRVPLDAPRDFLRNRQTLDQMEFQRIMGVLLNSFPAAVAADFIVPLTEAERRQQGIELVQINSAGHQEQAPRRNSYLYLANTVNVYQGSGTEARTMPLHSDATAYVTPLFDALLTTRSDFLATNFYLPPESFRNPQSHKPGYRFSIGTLVYSSDTAKFAVRDARLDEVKGLLTIKIDAHELFDRQLISKLPEGLDICVYGLGPDDRAQSLIHANTQNCGNATWKERSAARSVNLFGQDLAFQFSSREAEDLYYTASIGAYALAATTVTCFVFVGWVLSFNGRRQQTEKIVDLRTQQLQKEVRERRNVEDQLHRSMNMLESVNQGLSSFVVDNNKYKSLDELLYRIRDVSHAAGAMLGLVLERENGEKYLIGRGTDGFPITDNWSEPFSYLGGDWHEYLLMNTPISQCLETQTTHIFNDLSSASWNQKPEPLESVVVIPIHYENQMLAVISLANRPNGFTFALINYLEPLLVTLGVALKSMLDEAEKSRLNQQLIQQATTDPLTQLPNRNALQQELETLLNDWSGSGYIYVHVDLDRFDLINDNHGHLAGDHALRQFAGFMSNKLEKGDRIFHFNGDKFAMLLKYSGATPIEKPLQRLLDNIRSFRFSWNDSILSLNASIGAVCISDQDRDPSSLFQHADYACQLAKSMGRNRFQIYSADEHRPAKATDEMALLAKINSALENENFVVYTQPIEPLHAENGQGPQLEILARMLDDDGEVLTPNRFLPIMDRYGLSTLLDMQIIRKCLAWLQTLEHSDQSLPRITINLSGQSLADPRFLDYLLDTIPEYGNYWHLICFEITETLAISNLIGAQNMIKKLKKRGCKFALDDFGSGLSSFSYLKDFDVDYLKIDGTFVVDICDDERDQAMVRSIHEMAHALGMQTIAECAENQAIVAALRDTGVDYVQGYALGEPRPVEDYSR